MVISDWKSSGKDEWHKYTQNGKTPKQILGQDYEREQFFDGISIVHTVNGDWTLSSMYRQIPKKFQYKQGRLKTRSQALRLAKQYMRNN